MKKALFLFFALAYFTVILVSCGGENLAGTWKSEDGFTIIFNDDGTGKTEEEVFTWSVDGDILTMIVEDPQTGKTDTETFPFKLDDDKLIVTERGRPCTFVRVQ